MPRVVPRHSPGSFDLLRHSFVLGASILRSCEARSLCCPPCFRELGSCKGGCGQILDLTTGVCEKIALSDNALWEIKASEQPNQGRENKLCCRIAGQRLEGNSVGADTITAVFRTSILHVYGDSIRVLCLRGGIPKHTGNLLRKFDTKHLCKGEGS